MIRRWSCIIKLNGDLVDYKHFIRRSKIRLFRRAVRFRRLRIKQLSKFKRRKLRRFKHKTNWLIYLNIIKYWTDDIRICRQHSRFQYMYKFFINNYGAIANNSWSPRHRYLFGVQDQWVISGMTRKLIRSFRFDPVLRMLNRHKSSGRVNAFFLSKDVVSNSITFFFAAHFENADFAYNYDEENFTETLDFLSFQHEIILQQHLEVYKLLSILWYYRLGSLN